MSDLALSTTGAAFGAGVGGQLLARRLGIPAVAPLLVLGVLLGPSVLGFIRPAELGAGLKTIVGFGVAIILFEGGMSLKPGALKLAWKAIINLVVGGAFLTWFLAAAAARLAFPDLDAGIAIIFGSLVIVTGPTVIAPILQTVRPAPRVSAVLRAESILIDPLGALLAVFALDFIAAGPDVGWGEAAGGFGYRVLIGGVIGGATAFVLDRLLRMDHVVPPDLREIVVLGGAVACYAGAEAFAGESGVLAVTAAGFILGAMHPPGLDEIEEFKGRLTTVMLSLLFVLLAAAVPLDTMARLGWRGALLVALLVLVVRPLKVFVCTANTKLSWREKAFVAALGPRGILAAAVSSLFAIVLKERGVPDADLVVPLVFAVIFGTVLVLGPLAPLLAKILKIKDAPRTGVLIVGANIAGREIARALGASGRRVLLLDKDEDRVRRSNEAGLDARVGDALEDPLFERRSFDDVGVMIALTPNDRVNRVAIKLHGPHLGHDRARAVKAAEGPLEKKKDAPPFAFGERLNDQELSTALRAGASIASAKVDHDLAMKDFGEIEPGGVPLFVLKKDDSIRWLADDGDLKDGETVFYLKPAEAK
jgi:NhaP-type Na+/H+ or K+/H+ antiporter